MDQTPTKRTLNACVFCRGKKVKCLPSEMPGISACQKCYRDSLECQYPQTVQRKPRRRLANRVEQLEQSLSSVAAELASKRQLELSRSPDISGNSAVHPQVEPGFQTTSSSTSFNNSLPFCNCGSILDQETIIEADSRTLVDEFKLMAQHFPYVLIPNLSISDFSRERPLLLLSILTIASWRNRPLQIQLERQYLRDLAERMVVKGEQSLDMLQSLLVQLAWRHFHLKSAYQLTASAVSIVISLGLDRRPNEHKKLGVHFEFNGAANADSPNSTSSAESRRAYIGCYVVSTSWALSLRKSGALKYSKYLEECAMSLVAESEALSDLTIIHYLRLVHHAAEIDEAFGYGDTETTQNLTDEKVQFYIQHFEMQRDSLRLSLPPELANDTILHASHTLLHAYTIEVELYNISPTTISPSRMKLLVECLLSVKKTLDTVGALPDQHFQNLMGYNWAKIHYTIKLAIELTIGIASPSWSIESVRNIIKLETYIDLFCRRLNEQSCQIQSAPGQSDWFQLLYARWAGLKKAYLIGLQKKGVWVVGQDVLVLENGNRVLELQPDMTQDEIPWYNNTDLSSVDFMFSDWPLMQQGANVTF